jgi:Flp pilus assembly protein TadD
METLAEILKQENYQTAAFVGGFPVDSRFGLDQGFDVYEDSLPPPRSRVSLAERRAGDVVDLARRWIAEHGENRYFLWVHLFDPHAPYDPPDPFADEYEGEIAYVDSALKGLLASVPPEVLVAVTSDHGEGLGEHGESTHSIFVYDTTLRVPWLMRGPSVPPGSVVRDLARSIDLVPTLLDLLGMMDRCEACQGRSLAPALEGESIAPEPSYAETYFPRWNLGWSELRSLRAGRWKYIEAPEPELYEIASDPGETENRASENPGKVSELAAKLEAFARAAEREDRPSADPKSHVRVWEALESGIDLVQRGETDRAISALQTAVQSEPELKLARSYLALAYFERGRHAEAVSECEAILDHEPSDFEGTLLLGKSLLRLGRAAEARVTLERAAAIDEASPEPWVELSQLHLLARSRAEADAAFKEAAKRDDEAPSVLLLQGKLAMASGSIPYAEKLFRAVIEATPSEVEPRIQLGNLLLKERRLEEAEDLFRESLLLRPQSAELYLGLAHSRALAGKLPEAIGLFEQALVLSPTSTEVLNSLGYAYLEAGRSSEGVELFRRSIALDPSQPELRQFLTR